MKKLFYAIVALVIVCNAITSESDAGKAVCIPKNQSDNSEQIKANKKHNTKLYKVDYIVERFYENEIALEDELLNKKIFLIGRFFSLHKSPTSNSYELKLDWIDDNPFTTSISCEFPKSKKNDLKNLAKGDILIIKGALSRDSFSFSGLKFVCCSIEFVNPTQEDIDKIDS